jgi:hypothetical protein
MFDFWGIRSPPQFALKGLNIRDSDRHVVFNEELSDCRDGTFLVGLSSPELVHCRLAEMRFVKIIMESHGVIHRSID